MTNEFRDDFTDKVVELFHPDMDFPDILGAIKSLLALFENATAATAPPLSYFRLVAKCKVALWEDRPTRLEQDTAPAAQAEDVLGHRALFPDMDDEEIIEEIQRLQRSDQNVRAQAQYTQASWGDFRDRALLESTTLVEALSKVSVWDTENAVHQAMRNAPEDKHIAAHGGLWDTFSQSYLKEILERWGVNPYIARGWLDSAATHRRGATAEALWQLLDDIDTLSDRLKPSTAEGFGAFYYRALDLAKQRHALLKSDGHTLTWPESGDQVDIKSRYTFESLPDYDPLLADKYEDLKLGIETYVTGAAFESRHAVLHAKLLGSIGDLFNEAHVALRKPLEILLSCPVCYVRHVDVGEFATKPHHTHACQGCGHVWRPAKEPTVGVQYLSGYKNAPHGQDLVGKRVRVLRPLEPAHDGAPLGATHLVMKFDGPYADQNQERYEVLIGTYSLTLRREEFEAL